MPTVEEVCTALVQAGMPAKVCGEAGRHIEAVNTLEDAGPSEISFLANPKYERALKTTRAGAVIVGESVEVPEHLTTIRTRDPYAALQEVVQQIHGERQHPQWGIHPTAAVRDSACIGAGANIGPHVTVEEDVVIGENAVLYPGVYIGPRSRCGDNLTLYPNVVVYDDTILGNRVTVHAGSVIGEDGLGYAMVEGSWRKIPQVGHVVIDDDAEIGANCCIDRATLGQTVVGAGSKFSNLIAIGHGTKIGASAMFVAQVGVAGSVSVGKNVQMGGQAGVAGHLTIGDDARIGAKAGVLNDVEAGEYVMGLPAVKHTEARRNITLSLKLPELHKRLKALEAELSALREATHNDPKQVEDTIAVLMGSITTEANRVGLICGSGRFPLMVAEGAKRSGQHVVAVGIKGLADPELADLADEFYWAGVVRLGQVIRILRRRGCMRAILAGSVRKSEMYDLPLGLGRILYYCPDWTTFRLWFFRVADKRPDTMLKAIANEFEGKGITLEDCCKFNADAMAGEGVLTTRKPTAAQQKDIEFGWHIAKELGRLDIGQSVAVKELDIIAVEAIEGTDRMIHRAGELCRSGGWCHIKVSKPNQDMRFDVPTIGPDTIENLSSHGARVLCVEAGKTFIVDPQHTMALAEKLGMVIVGRCGPE